MTALLVASACALATRIVAERLLRRAGRWPRSYDWPRWAWRVRLAVTAPRRRTAGTPHDTMRVRPRAYTRTTTPQPREHP